MQFMEVKASQPCSHIILYSYYIYIIFLRIVYNIMCLIRIHLYLPAIRGALCGMSTGLVTGFHRIRTAVCRTDFEHWPRGHRLPA